MTAAAIQRSLKPAHLLIAAAFFFSWYLMVADGLWGYAQHLILKKKYVPASVFVALMGALILLYRRQLDKSFNSTALPLLYAWSCWMLIVLLIAGDITFASPFRIAFGFYVNYWHFFLAALAINTAFRIQEKTFLQLFLITAIPIIVLGVAQGVMQDNFAIGTWIAQEAASFNLGFFGMRRANSVFAHAEDLGYFAGIVISVCTALLLHFKAMRIRLALLALMAATGLALFFTLTRATYLMTACATLATLFIYKARGQQEKWLPWLPLLFFAAGLAIYFSAPLIRMLSFSDSILSSASLGERLYGNKYYMTEIQRHGWYTFFTGLGWFMNGHYKATHAIDNQFIALVLSSGVVGLLFWLAVTFVIWKELLSRALRTRSPVLIGLTGVASTWLTQSIFNVTSTIAFAAIVAFVIAPQFTAQDDPKRE